MAIESEEKRKRIRKDIERWCEHVKATSLLRPGDSEELVRTILEEFYHITLCCGHMIKDPDEGIIIEFYEFEDKSKGTVRGSYCKDCAEIYEKKLGAWEVKNKT